MALAHEERLLDELIAAAVDDTALTEAEYRSPEEFASAVLNNLPAIAYALGAGMPVTRWRPARRNAGEEQRALRAVRQWGEQARTAILAFVAGDIDADMLTARLKATYQRHARNSYMAGRRSMGNVSALTPAEEADLFAAIAGEDEDLPSFLNSPTAQGGVGIGTLIRAMFSPEALTDPLNFFGSGLPGDPFAGFPPPLGAGAKPKVKPSTGLGAAQRLGDAPRTADAALDARAAGAEMVDDVLRRIDDGGDRIRSLSNMGELDALSTGMPASAAMAWWVLGAGDHCVDCVRLSAQSPYYASTLADTGMYPGSGHTRCRGRCRCHVEYDVPAEVCTDPMRGSGSLGALIEAADGRRVNVWVQEATTCSYPQSIDSFAAENGLQAIPGEDPYTWDEDVAALITADEPVAYADLSAEERAAFAFLERLVPGGDLSALRATRYRLDSSEYLALWQEIGGALRFEVGTTVRGVGVIDPDFTLRALHDLARQADQRGLRIEINGATSNAGMTRWLATFGAERQTFGGGLPMVTPDFAQMDALAAHALPVRSNPAFVGPAQPLDEMRSVLPRRPDGARYDPNVGVSPKDLLRDDQGRDWLVKYSAEANDPAGPIRALPEIVGTQIHEILGSRVAPVGPAVHGGRAGTVQQVLPNTKSLIARDLDVHDLTREQQLEVMRQGIVDRLVGNLDAHGGNYLLDEDGVLTGIDKGLSFWHLTVRHGEDMADNRQSVMWNFGVRPENRRTSDLWSNISPTDVEEMLQRVESWPTADYVAFASRVIPGLRAGTPHPKTSAQYRGWIRERKENLRKDVTAFFEWAAGQADHRTPITHEWQEFLRTKTFVQRPRAGVAPGAAKPGLDHAIARVAAAEPRADITPATWESLTSNTPPTGVPGSTIEHKGAVWDYAVRYGDDGKPSAIAQLGINRWGWVPDPQHPGKQMARQRELLVVEAVRTRPGLTGQGHASALYDWLQDATDLNLYTAVGTTVTPDGKAFLTKWLQHRKAIEEPPIAGIAPRPHPIIEPKPTYVLPEVDALPAWPDMGLVKSQANTASLGGANPKQILVDPSGQEFLFKAGVSEQPAVDEAAVILAQRIGLRVPSVQRVTYDSIEGTIQPLIPKARSLQRQIKLGQIDAEVLDVDGLREVARQSVLDFVLANADGHGGNFVTDATGRMWGVDKGRSFVGAVGASGNAQAFFTPAYGGGSVFGNAVLFPERSKVWTRLRPSDISDVLNRLDGISTDEFARISADAIEKVLIPFGTPEQALEVLLQRKAAARGQFEAWFRDALAAPDVGEISDEWRLWLKAGGTFDLAPVVPAGEAKRLLPAPPETSVPPPEYRSSAKQASRVGNDLAILPAGFVPAATVPEAIARLQKALPKTTGNITGGFSLGQLNAIIARAETMGQMGVDMTRLRRLGDFTLVPQADQARGIGLTYKGDRIALNHDYQWKYLGGVDSPDTVYNDIGGLFAHEYGHVAFAHLGAEQQGRMIALHKAHVTSAGGDLSQYAATDVDEWVGEVMAAVTTPGYKPGTLAYDEDFWTILSAGDGTKAAVKADMTPPLAKVDPPAAPQAPIPTEPVGPPVPAPAKTWLKQGDPQQYTLPESLLPVNTPATKWTGYVPSEPPLPSVAATKEAIATAKARHDAVMRDWHDVAEGRVPAAFSWAKVDAEDAAKAGLHVEKIGDQYVIARGPTALDAHRAYIAAGGTSNDDGFWHLMGYSDGDLAAYDAYYEAKKGLRLTAGVVMVEPDGRMWLLAPKNKFAGYENTWIKGGVDGGETAAEAAVREMMEEAGFSVELDRYLGDYVNTDRTGVARMYIGHRTGGGPLWAHAKETYEIRLVDPADAQGMLLRYGKPDERDQRILADAVAALDGGPGIEQAVIPEAGVAELAAKTAPEPTVWWPSPKQVTSPSLPKAGIAPQQPLSTTFGFDHTVWKTFTPSESPASVKFPMNTTRWTLADGSSQPMYWQRGSGLGTTPGADRLFWANSKKQLADPHMRLSLHVAQVVRFSEVMAGDPLIDILRVNEALLDNVPGLRDLLVAAGGQSGGYGKYLELGAAEVHALAAAITTNTPLGAVPLPPTGVPLAPTPTAVGIAGIDPAAVGTMLDGAAYPLAINTSGGLTALTLPGGSVGWATTHAYGYPSHVGLMGPGKMVTAQQRDAMLVATIAHMDAVLKALPDAYPRVEFAVGWGNIDAVMTALQGQKVLGGNWSLTADQVAAIATTAKAQMASAGFAPAMLDFSLPGAAVPPPPLAGLYKAGTVQRLAQAGVATDYAPLSYQIGGTKIGWGLQPQPSGAFGVETLTLDSMLAKGKEPLDEVLGILATMGAEIDQGAIYSVRVNKAVLDEVPGLAAILKGHGAVPVPGKPADLWLDETAGSAMVKALWDGTPGPGTIVPSGPSAVAGSVPDGLTGTVTPASSALGGTSAKGILTDSTGQKWLFKADPTGSVVHGKTPVGVREEAATALAAKLGLNTPPATATTYQGYTGSLQPLVGNQSVKPLGGPSDLPNLTPDQTRELMRQSVLDHLIGNRDASFNQYLIGPDGQLHGIDKGATFESLVSGKQVPLKVPTAATLGTDPLMGQPATRFWMKAIEAPSLLGKISPSDFAGPLKAIAAMTDVEYLGPLKGVVAAVAKATGKTEDVVSAALLARKVTTTQDFETFVIANLKAAQKNGPLPIEWDTWLAQGGSFTGAMPTATYSAPAVTTATAAMVTPASAAPLTDALAGLTESKITVGGIPLVKASTSMGNFEWRRLGNDLELHDVLGDDAITAAVIRLGKYADEAPKVSALRIKPGAWAGLTDTQRSLVVQAGGKVAPSGTVSLPRQNLLMLRDQLTQDLKAAAAPPPPTATLLPSIGVKPDEAGALQATVIPQKQGFEKVEYSHPSWAAPLAIRQRNLSDTIVWSNVSGGTDPQRLTAAMRHIARMADQMDGDSLKMQVRFENLTAQMPPSFAVFLKAHGGYDVGTVTFLKRDDVLALRALIEPELGHSAVTAAAGAITPPPTASLVEALGIDPSAVMALGAGGTVSNVAGQTAKYYRKWPNGVETYYELGVTGIIRFTGVVGLDATSRAVATLAQLRAFGGGALTIEIGPGILTTHWGGQIRDALVGAGAFASAPDLITVEPALMQALADAIANNTSLAPIGPMAVTPTPVPTPANSGAALSAQLGYDHDSLLNTGTLFSSDDLALDATGTLALSVPGMPSGFFIDFEKTGTPGAFDQLVLDVAANSNHGADSATVGVLAALMQTKAYFDGGGTELSVRLVGNVPQPVKDFLGSQGWAPNAPEFLIVKSDLADLVTLLEGDTAVGTTALGSAIANPPIPAPKDPLALIGKPYLGDPLGYKAGPIHFTGPAVAATDYLSGEVAVQFIGNGQVTLWLSIAPGQISDNEAMQAALSFLHDLGQGHKASGAAEFYVSKSVTAHPKVAGLEYLLKGYGATSDAVAWKLNTAQLDELLAGLDQTSLMAGGVPFVPPAPPLAPPHVPSWPNKYGFSKAGSEGLPMPTVTPQAQGFVSVEWGTAGKAKYRQSSSTITLATGPKGTTSPEVFVGLLQHFGAVLDTTTSVKTVRFAADQIPTGSLKALLTDEGKAVLDGAYFSIERQNFLAMRDALIADLSGTGHLPGVAASAAAGTMVPPATPAALAVGDQVKVTTAGAGGDVMTVTKVLPSGKVELAYPDGSDVGWPIDPTMLTKVYPTGVPAAAAGTPPPKMFVKYGIDEDHLASYEAYANSGWSPWGKAYATDYVDATVAVGTSAWGTPQHFVKGALSPKVEITGKKLATRWSIAKIAYGTNEQQRAALYVHLRQMVNASNGNVPIFVPETLLAQFEGLRRLLLDAGATDKTFASFGTGLDLGKKQVAALKATFAASAPATPIGHTPAAAAVSGKIGQPVTLADTVVGDVLVHNATGNTYSVDTLTGSVAVLSPLNGGGPIPMDISGGLPGFAYANAPSPAGAAPVAAAPAPVAPVTPAAPAAPVVPAGAIGAAPPTSAPGAIAGPAVAPPTVTPAFLYGYDAGFVATNTPADLGVIDYGTGGAAGPKKIMGVGQAKGYWSISSSGARSGLFGFEPVAGMTVEETRSAAFAMLRLVAEDGAQRPKGFFIKPEFYDKVDGLRQMILDAGGAEADWGTIGTAVAMDAAAAQKLVDALKGNVMGPIKPGFKTTSEYLGFTHANALSTIKGHPVIDAKKGEFTWTVGTKKAKVQSSISADRTTGSVTIVTGDTVSAPIAAAAQIAWLADQGASEIVITKDVLDKVAGLRQWLLTVGGKVDGGVIRLDDAAVGTAAKMIAKDALPVGLGGQPLPYSVFDDLRANANDVAEALGKHSIDTTAPVSTSAFTVGTAKVGTRWSRSGTNIYWQSIDRGKATIGEGRAAAAAQLRVFANNLAQDIGIERLDISVAVLADQPALRTALRRYGGTEIPAAGDREAYVSLTRPQALKMRADIEAEFTQIGVSTTGSGGATYISQQAAAISWPTADGLSYDLGSTRTLVGAKTTAGSTAAMKKLALYRDANGEEWLFKPGASGRGAITDSAVAELALALGLPVPPTRLYTLTFDGKPTTGSLQKMLPGAKSIKRVEDLTPTQSEDMLRHSVLDWVTNNDDGHAGNWLVAPDGHLWAIDKSRSFQTWGSQTDRLFTDNPGNGYPALMFEFFKKVRADPKVLSQIHPQTIAATLRALNNIPEDRFRQMMAPIAAANRRTPAEAAKLLDQMVARKNSAVADFETYFRGEIDEALKRNRAAVPAEWAAWRKAGGTINVHATPEDLWREAKGQLDAEFGAYSPTRAQQLFNETSLQPIDQTLRRYFGSGVHGGTTVKVGGQSLHSYQSELIRPELIAKGMETQVRKWERLHRWALLNVLDGGTSIAGTSVDTIIRKWWDPAKGTIRVTRTAAMRGGSPAATLDHYMKNGFRDMVGSAVGRWTQVGAGSTPVNMVIEVPVEQVFASFPFGYSNSGASVGENEFMVTDVRGDQIVYISRQQLPANQVPGYTGPIVK